MNNQFTTPEIKVIKFEVEDILLISGLLPEGMEDGGSGSGGSTGY